MAKDVDVFNYSAYRGYLRDWIAENRTGKGVNLTRLASVAQVHPTFLSHVLSGSKHLSLEQAALLSEFMNHTPLERDYFFVLLHIDRAGTKTLKDYWFEKKSLIEAEKNQIFRRFEKHKQLSDVQRVQFYSSWIYVAIWVSSSIEDRRQSLQQIADRFGISRSRAEKVLQFLVEAGLCTEENGQYSIGETHIHVPNESSFVLNHHRNWRMKAIEKMDDRKNDELFFTAPMAISAHDFASLRERINVFINETVNMAKASTAEDVVCLNIDFFRGPWTR